MRIDCNLNAATCYMREMYRVRSSWYGAWWDCLSISKNQLKEADSRFWFCYWESVGSGIRIDPSLLGIIFMRSQSVWIVVSIVPLAFVAWWRQLWCAGVSREQSARGGDADSSTHQALCPPCQLGWIPTGRLWCTTLQQGGSHGTSPLRAAQNSRSLSRCPKGYPTPSKYHRALANMWCVTLHNG